MLRRVHQATDHTWGPEILDILLPGPLRYTDLLDKLHGIADKPVHSRTFQATLRALVRQGLLEHRKAQAPKKYALTASGRRLTQALQLLEAWDQQHPAKQPDTHDEWPK
ncbi:winged helix-turn-helix transcriptional regulator [Micromonospora aurantiaca (nom. illeg.)]|uniref:winged helix-turn-helix transcriptional regulator n=1 Tax=Micromonospora aurantiaca (nom. illeg.) TaxID=47850 RepID=UPI003408EDAA